MAIIKTSYENGLLMTRYYRIEGNWISFTCSFGSFMILLTVIFTNDLLISSIVGIEGLMTLFVAAIGLFFIPWMFFNPILWTRRWFLSITQKGFLDYAFGYKRFYPWNSIQSHEIKQTRLDATGRYRHDLILKLEDKTVYLQLDKYGIDTEGEVSSFMTELETLLLDV